jgi:hypothetical protein
MPTADETPTLDAQPDNTLDIDTITTELELWRARYVLARRRRRPQVPVATCTEALDKWLDILSDALLEQKYQR